MKTVRHLLIAALLGAITLSNVFAAVNVYTINQLNDCLDNSDFTTIESTILSIEDADTLQEALDVISKTKDEQAFQLSIEAVNELISKKPAIAQQVTFTEVINKATYLQLNTLVATLNESIDHAKTIVSSDTGSIVAHAKAVAPAPLSITGGGSGGTPVSVSPSKKK